MSLNITLSLQRRNAYVALYCRLFDLRV